MKLNCYEICMKQLLLLHKIDVRILFADSFSFGFNNNISIGKGISLSRTGKGISQNASTILKCANIDMILIDDIDKYTNDNLICNIDSFFCPSTPYYMIEHIIHFIHVKFVDNLKVFYDDPYYNKYNCIIDINDFKKATKAIYIFNFEKASNIINVDKLIKIAKINIERKINGKNQFDELESFIKLFQNFIDKILRDEINNFEFDKSWLMREIAYISWGRENFSEFLQLINYHEHSDIFIQLSNLWSLLSSAIMKYTFSKKTNDKNIILDFTNDILAQELNCVNILNSIQIDN